MDLTPERVLALAFFGGLCVYAYRVRGHPGGPLLFGLEHPRTAVFLATATLVGAGALVVVDGLRDVRPHLRPLLNDYLIRLAVVAFVCGSTFVAIGILRRQPGARGYAATLRAMMQTRYMVIGVAVVPAAALLSFWFNPVPSAPPNVAAAVALLALTAPWLLSSLVQAFLFRSTIPSVSAVVTAFGEESLEGTAEDGPA